MNQKFSNWRQGVAVSKLPKMLLLAVMLIASSVTFSQSSGTAVYMARMTHDNSVTIRSGLHETYNIPVGHFNFSSTQEAVAYFQARDVDYIDFVVVDTENVQLQLDLSNPAVANWTLSDWNQALANRAANAAPRALTNN